MNEFSLIDQFFKPFALKRKEVIFGIGDDAACLHIPFDTHLLVSTDTLVSGTHFLPEWNPYDIAWKAAMVNISDIAAMAAEPAFLTLALTLPELNEDWLTSFSQGLYDALNHYHIDLIGGDTTRGPLSITLTLMGLAAQGKAVRRNGAKPGDIILISGQIGAAALAVAYLARKDLPPGAHAQLMNALLRPQPRVDLITILQQFATSAIDISDGLSADLNHICNASHAGATLDHDAIPVHPLVKNYLGEQAVDLALTGGDDYELCFTVPAKHLDDVMLEFRQINSVCYPIGVITEKPGLRIKKAEHCVELIPKGYSHF